MKLKVDLDQTYPHDIALVWRALTEASALGNWLMPTDFKPLIGYRFRLDNGTRKIKGKVIEVEEQKSIAYTWDDEDGESVVSWTLQPVDGGTHVHLEHRPVEKPEVTCLLPDCYFNWSYAMRHSLPGLMRLLEAGGQPRPPMIYLEEVAR